MDERCACGNPVFGRCKECGESFCQHHAPSEPAGLVPYGRTLVTDRCQQCHMREAQRHADEKRRAKRYDRDLTRKRSAELKAQADAEAAVTKRRIEALPPMAASQLAQFFVDGTVPHGERLGDYCASEVAAALVRASRAAPASYTPLVRWVATVRRPRKKRRVKGWTVIRRLDTGSYRSCVGYVLTVKGRVYEGVGHGKESFSDCVPHDGSFVVTSEDLRVLSGAVTHRVPVLSPQVESERTIRALRDQDLDD